jgi:hypothetical protein
MITVNASTRQGRVGIAFLGAILFPAQQVGGPPARAACPEAAAARLCLG